MIEAVSNLSSDIKLDIVHVLYDFHEDITLIHVTHEIVEFVKLCD